MPDNLIRLTIDGHEVAVPATKIAYDPTNKRDVEIPTTIYDAASTLPINPIPVLCHREHVNPVAVCRVCCVEVGGRVLSPACYRPVEQGMKVQTAATSPRVRDSVKVLTELLLADQPSSPTKDGSNPNELFQLAKKQGLTGSRYPKAKSDRGHDDSSIVIAVDHNACILCDRCIRGCNEIRDNQVLGRMGKGYTAKIAFDLNNPMGDSSCVACGECMISCPTGALTFRAPVESDPWKDVTPPPGPVSPEELSRLPLFQGVALPFLDWNKSSVVRRHFKKGDVICREGEYGSTAFFLEKGKVDIFINSPLKHVRSKKKGGWGPFSLLGRLVSSLADRREDPRDEDEKPSHIFTDAPVALPYDKPVASMEAGDIFGEMTCMSHYPRAATVRAAEDCTVLEMLRNVLYILQRNKTSRQMLEDRYRARALDNQLRGARIFSSLLENEDRFQRFVDYLRGTDENGEKRIELVQLHPGEILFHQDDPADHFYMVRIGFVKIAQRRPGGEEVLGYLGPGKYFGEIGLMSHIPEIAALAPPGVRVASCSALDHVDLVRVNGKAFRKVLEDFPEVRQQIVELALKRLEENEVRRKEVATVPLGDYLRQGLFEAQSLLVLDLEKCTRCDECTKACADVHDGVTRLVREGLRFDKFLVASSCRSCLDPYCMVGCPVGSIRRRNSREIIIEDWCIGCGKCAENCPYGNINMHPFQTDKLGDDPDHPGRQVPIVQQKATTCDLCTDVRDHQPSCVYACPHDAAHRMSGKELLERIDR